VICEYDGHTVHRLIHWRITADLLVPRESECSWMWPDAKLYQGHLTGSHDIQNGQILSGQPPYVNTVQSWGFVNWYLVLFVVWVVTKLIMISVCKVTDPLYQLCTALSQ
jgi:hypothetical protein